MSETAEKLFFRYQPGDCNSYSLSTLLSITHTLPRYGRFIRKNPKAFTLFLSEIPLCILSYYAYILHMIPEFESIFSKKQIVDRLAQIRSSPSTLHLAEQLHTLNDVFSLHVLHDNALCVTIKKPFQANSFFTSDILITLTAQGILIHDIPNESHRNEYNLSYVKHSRHVISSFIHQFQQKYRLELCFL